MSYNDIGKIIEKGVTETKYIHKYLKKENYNLNNYQIDEFIKKLRSMYGVIYQKIGEDWKEKHLKVIEVSKTFKELTEEEKYNHSWEYINKIQEIYLKNYKIKSKRIY